MTRNIPRGEWRGELDSFSRQHEGWIVSVTPDCTKVPDVASEYTLSAVSILLAVIEGPSASGVPVGRGGQPSIGASGPASLDDPALPAVPAVLPELPPVPAEPPVPLLPPPPVPAVPLVPPELSPIGGVSSSFPHPPTMGGTTASTAAMPQS